MLQTTRFFLNNMWHSTIGGIQLFYQEFHLVYNLLGLDWLRAFQVVLTWNALSQSFSIQGSSTHHVEDFLNQLTWHDETLKF